MVAKFFILLATLTAIEDKSRIYAPATHQAGDWPVQLSDGPHLFLDDFLIAQASGTRRVVNPPSRDVTHQNPIITGKQDGCFQPYMSIVRDEQTRRFRIWYGARTEDRNPSRSRLAYTESDDGIHWQRPHRLLDTPMIQFGASVIDEGPDCADKSRRFKFAWWAPSITEGQPPGMKVASSPDGLTWAQMTRPGAVSDVVLPHNHDINGIFRHAARRRYIGIASTHVSDPAWQGERRVTTSAVSDDLLHWRGPWRILVPNPKIEHEQTQFYAMDGIIARGHWLVAMVKVLRDDLKADDPPDPPGAYGIGFTTLAWSRDGEHWTRDREVFFDRDPRKGAWDHAHAWIDEQVLVCDEVYLYYGGYARGHKVDRFEERQIGLVMMKRDRYVAREAAGEGGEIVTRPIVVDADSLTLNADASAGEIRAAVLDESGSPIAGFGLDDCDPIRGDGLDLPVRWKSPLNQLRGRTIRLKFKLTSARLFAFDN